MKSYNTVQLRIFQIVRIMTKMPIIHYVSTYIRYKMKINNIGRCDHNFKYGILVSLHSTLKQLIKSGIILI